MKGTGMRRHSAVVAVAAGALVLAVNIKSMGQSPPAAVSKHLSTTAGPIAQPAAPKPSAKFPAKAACRARQ